MELTELQEALSLKLSKKIKKLVPNFNKNIHNNFLGSKTRYVEKTQENTEVPTMSSFMKERITIAIKDIVRVDTVDLTDEGILKNEVLLDGHQKRKIGSILSKHRDGKYLREYNDFRKDIGSNDPHTDYEIVISKDPYDIAGMSTGRSWKSCVSIFDVNPQTGKKTDSGMHEESGIITTRSGSMIAYLVKKGDTNIRKPVARVLLKPYFLVNPTDIAIELGYITTEEFEEKVHQHEEELFPEIKNEAYSNDIEVRTQHGVMYFVQWLLIENDAKIILENKVFKQYLNKFFPSDPQQTFGFFNKGKNVNENYKLLYTGFVDFCIGVFADKWVLEHVKKLGILNIKNEKRLKDFGYENWRDEVFKGIQFKKIYDDIFEEEFFEQHRDEMYEMAYMQASDSLNMSHSYNVLDDLGELFDTIDMEDIDLPSVPEQRDIEYADNSQAIFIPSIVYGDVPWKVDFLQTIQDFLEEGNEKAESGYYVISNDVYIDTGDIRVFEH